MNCKFTTEQLDEILKGAFENYRSPEEIMEERRAQFMREHHPAMQIMRLLRGENTSNLIRHIREIAASRPAEASGARTETARVNTHETSSRPISTNINSEETEAVEAVRRFEEQREAEQLREALEQIAMLNQQETHEPNTYDGDGKDPVYD